jgi:hypothetical protein
VDPQLNVDLEYTATLLRMSQSTFSLEKLRDEPNFVLFFSLVLDDVFCDMSYGQFKQGWMILINGMSECGKKQSWSVVGQCSSIL